MAKLFVDLFKLRERIMKDGRSGQRGGVVEVRVWGGISGGVGGSGGRERRLTGSFKFPNCFQF